MVADITLDGRKHEGLVTAISPEVRSGPGHRPREFAGEQPPGLRQNQRGSVRIVIDERADVLKFERSSDIGPTTRPSTSCATIPRVRTPVELGAASVGEIEVLRPRARRRSHHLRHRRLRTTSPNSTSAADRRNHHDTGATSQCSRCTDISKIYRADLIETHALRDFSLKCGDGEFVAVTGPSGSGKTTFLNVAGLLETFDTGTYKLDGAGREPPCRTTHARGCATRRSASSSRAST